MEDTEREGEEPVEEVAPQRPSRTRNKVAMDDVYGKLEEVRGLVRQLLAAYKLVNRDAIEKGRESVLKDKTRKRIFDLCDKKHAVNQMAQAVFPEKPLTTSQPAVSYHLSILEDYGLVAYVDKGGQRYYYKIRG